MPLIRVLPDRLINRIAAGEVVERPASVVKELVENSLDAGASSIEIELRAGGRSLVRVRDDGSGMAPDDALLALERHATSKISAAEDLDHLTSLGFRGEALPSIAAVSRFELLTAADVTEGGYRVEVEGGRVLAAEPAARARGTTVTVRDLFFNVPARRKFLRAAETELRHVQEGLWGQALARPDVAFVVRHGERALIDAPAVADWSERVPAMWRNIERVFRFDAGSPAGRAEGLFAPGTGRGRPTLVLLVNGRVVRDRLLVGAVMRVLRSGGEFGGSRLVVELRLPPDEVDVNVHPAKAEVRFARAGGVFALVERAVREGVAASRGQVAVSGIDDGPPRSVGQVPPAAWGAPLDFGGRPAAGGLFPHPAYDATSDELPTALAAGTHQRRSTARPGPADTPFGRLIGQYRSSFLLLEDEHGLVIVDQHVAHERVLYERILRRLESGNAPSQGLLAAQVIEVGEANAAALGAVAPLLADVGIDAELFGPTAIRVSAVPPELDAESVQEVVEELLDRATRLDGVPERAREELREEVAASLSCRAAVKINHPLSSSEQHALLDDLAAAEHPYRCPHGRPIILRLSQQEMERRLGRR